MKNWRSKLSLSKGYTIVELLIVITIIGILITFTYSGFVKSGERQTISQAQEQILSVLQGAQKASYVGNKDCTGSLSGIEVKFTATTITSQAKCINSFGVANSGALKSTTVPNVTFVTTPTITFKPLSLGADQADIDYKIAGITYRVSVKGAGTITYMGKIAP